MGSSPRGVPAVQFHNPNPSITEDIEICQSYMTALSSRHQYLCFSPMDSSPKAMIISCPWPISEFKLEIQCPLAKMLWKNISHYGWPMKKILVSWSNSYLEMLVKEICFVDPVDCFSLHCFIVDCFLFHCTSHCIF